MMNSLLPGLDAAPNLHPLVVHFPIAFWVAATGFWALSLLRRNQEFWTFGLWLQALGALSGAVAVALGYWATSQMGHGGAGHEFVHVHRDIMLGATLLGILVAGLSWWKRSSKRWRVPLLVGSVIQLGVMAAGADRGAELVYRYGVGVAQPGSTMEHSGDDSGEEAHGDHSH